MRWNLVIGGQMISKSFRGFNTYHPEWFVKEGLVPAMVIFAMPFLILFTISRVVPLFRPEKGVAAGCRVFNIRTL